MLNILVHIVYTDRLDVSVQTGARFVPQILTTATSFHIHFQFRYTNPVICDYKIRYIWGAGVESVTILKSVYKFVSRFRTTKAGRCCHIWMIAHSKCITVCVYL